MDGWIRWMDGVIDGRMDGLDGRTDGWIRWTDGWTDGGKDESSGDGEMVVRRME